MKKTGILAMTGLLLVAVVSSAMAMPGNGPSNSVQIAQYVEQDATMSAMGRGQGGGAKSGPADGTGSKSKGSNPNKGTCPN